MLNTGRSRSQLIAAGVDFRQHVALAASKFSIQSERIVSFWPHLVDVIKATGRCKFTVGRTGNPSCDRRFTVGRVANPSYDRAVPGMVPSGGRLSRRESQEFAEAVPGDVTGIFSPDVLEQISVLTDQVPYGFFPAGSGIDGRRAARRIEYRPCRRG